jgi:hypothetical protein
MRDFALNFPRPNVPAHELKSRGGSVRAGLVTFFVSSPMLRTKKVTHVLRGYEENLSAEETVCTPYLEIANSFHECSPALRCSRPSPSARPAIRGERGRRTVPCEGYYLG